MLKGVAYSEGGETLGQARRIRGRILNICGREVILSKATGYWSSGLPLTFWAATADGTTLKHQEFSRGRMIAWLDSDEGREAVRRIGLDSIPYEEPERAGGLERIVRVEDPRDDAYTVGVKRLLRDRPDWQD